MSSVGDVATIIAHLQGDSSRADGYVRRRMATSSQVGLYVAVEKPDNRAALLLEVAASSVPANITFPAPTQGFTISALPLVPGPAGLVRYVLKLADDRYLDVFVTLADDVVAHVAPTPDETSAVRAFAGRIARWQMFLARTAAEGLTEEQQRGLYGELWFLFRFVLQELPPSAAVGAWQGPDSAAHDFGFGACAIEVKTTIATSHPTMRISNQRQLEDPAVDGLLLACLLLDSRRGGDATLPALVGAIRMRFAETDPTAGNEFEERLFKAGYLDVHEVRYSAHSYEVREFRGYEIREGFPRIRGCDLVEGVGEVEYSVSLGACNLFRLSDESVRAMLREKRM